MTRSPETPIILWICAAVCAHFLFAEGGGTIAEHYEDSSYLLGMGARARGAAATRDQTVDIITNEDGKAEEEEPKPEEPKLEAKKEEKKPDEKKPEPPKPEVKKPEPPPPAPVKIAVQEEDPLKKLDQTPLKQDNRIAVKQHVADKKQEDNPNAKFIADEANKVQEESVATQTSHDEDDPNPTPGANKLAGPKDRVGDSEKTKIAESEEHKGEQNKAPGEKGTEFDIQHDNKPIDRPMGPVAAASLPPSEAIPRAGGDGRTPGQTSQNQPQPQLVPGAPPTDSPEVAQGGSNGTWIVNPMRPGATNDPSTGVPGTTNQKQPIAQNQPSTKWLGLGGQAAPGQLNLNLSQNGVVAAVGADQLRKEREADGERRKSEHRGSWTASSFERWRNAIENYVSSVKPGNQTSLNTAAVPFASYLNTIHNRIHPIFADNFLGSLDSLPKTHPMNNPKMVTRLEIVVSPKEGRIVKMGIVKTSGITAFDIAALDSVNRAQPFGPAPGAIVSPDGNVYLHWEFHRDEVFACSTMHARPFMLNTPAKPQSPEPEPPGSPNSPTRERGAPPPVNVQGTREGRLELPPLSRPLTAG
ncbi:MAG: TonB C-terminal domain-containing protein [Labilithrix sp.]|nr:TonB C-terminal domain-containing protein [Labilithrix sp.]MCW5811680.1 TonB C-terminal domain-containing protein [Labilithrix sp.]